MIEISNKFVVLLHFVSVNNVVLFLSVTCKLKKGGLYTKFVLFIFDNKRIKMTTMHHNDRKGHVLTFLARLDAAAGSYLTQAVFDVEGNVCVCVCVLLSK